MNTKTKKPLVFFMKTEDQMLKNEKSIAIMNTKTKKLKSFGTKTDPRNSQNHKT